MQGSPEMTVLDLDDYQGAASLAEAGAGYEYDYSVGGTHTLTDKYSTARSGSSFTLENDAHVDVPESQSEVDAFYGRVADGDADTDEEVASSPPVLVPSLAAGNPVALLENVSDKGAHGDRDDKHATRSLSVEPTPIGGTTLEDSCKFLLPPLHSYDRDLTCSHRRVRFHLWLWTRSG